MFCPKCGGSNPDNGKFCRSCGQDLSPVSIALKANNIQTSLSCSDQKDLTLEGSFTKIFMGVAFLVVSGILGLTGIAGGRAWWFWMLIPAFAMLGTGIAQYLQIRRNEAALQAGAPAVSMNSIDQGKVNALPNQKPEIATSASRYRTGDLVPPSVTDNTTRHLEIDKEGQTMTLPQK